MAQDNFEAKDVGTTPVSVLTPAATINVTGMSVFNTSANSIEVDVFKTKGGVDYYYAKGMPLPVKMGWTFFGGDQKIVLKSGDVLKVKSSAAASLDVNGSTATL